MISCKKRCPTRKLSALGIVLYNDLPFLILLFVSKVKVSATALLSHLSEFSRTLLPLELLHLLLEVAARISN